MYCQKCGAQNPDEARFCRECGCQIGISVNENKLESEFAKLAPAEEPNWLIKELNELLNK